MRKQVNGMLEWKKLLNPNRPRPTTNLGDHREQFERDFDKRDPLSNLLGGKQQLIQDFRKFEGNAQTLRIVSKLQILADPHGLNLTFGTLSAACKYVLPSHLAGKGKGHSGSKPGFFASENKLIKIIRQQTATGQSRNPITLLVEAADDIVYSVADIEDGIKKAVIRWSDLEEILRTKLGKRADAVLGLKDTILKAGRTELSTHLPDDIHGTAFRSAAIALLVPDAAVTFLKNYSEIMRGKYRGELVEDGELADLIKCLQEIGHEKVYCTPSTLKLELMGKRIISDLMDLFWEGAKKIDVDGTFGTKKFSGKIAALISDNYRRVFANSVADMPELPEQYHRLQLVTDYVCGMTDSFAKQLHLELTNG